MVKLRILFVLPSLEMGGAERVVCNLLTALPRARFEMHLAVMNGAGPLRQTLPSDVCVHDLNSPRVSRAALPLLRLLWRLRPSRVVATGSHLNIMASLLRPLFPPGCRLLIRESAPVAFLEKSPGSVMKFLAMASYRLADGVIAQSVAGSKELRDQLHLPNSRITQLYNPVPFEQIDLFTEAADSPFPGGTVGPNIVSVARLDPVKRLGHLIEAFRGLVQRSPSARLWIVGEGTERPKLERFIHSLDLCDSVTLVGFDADPWRWMRHADLFVLCSHVESLPNSLLEAIACRCPVVTLDVPGGTREIMDRLGLSSRIVSRLEDWNEEWFARPGPSVRQSAERLLGLDTIVEQYTRVLSAIDFRDLQEPVQTVQAPSLNGNRRAA